jgi:hypothetical protein
VSESEGQPHGSETPAQENDGQEYLDRSRLDFDPDEGLLSGTAVDGNSEIPGPHEADGYSERGDHVELGENADVDPPSRSADGEDGDG